MLCPCLSDLHKHPRCKDMKVLNKDDASTPAPPPRSPTLKNPQVLLVANNTLIVDNASVLGLFNSTLWLAETSWLKIANNSLLNLNDSRLNVTNFFTW